MEEWPQRPVGIAVIIFVDVLFFEVDRRRGDAAFAVEVHMPGELLGLLARPAEPDAAIFLQRRRQRDREAALRAGGALGLGRRHAAGDDDEPAHRMAPQGFDKKTSQLIHPTHETVCGYL